MANMARVAATAPASPEAVVELGGLGALGIEADAPEIGLAEGDADGATEVVGESVVFEQADAVARVMAIRMDLMGKDMPRR